MTEKRSDYRKNQRHKKLSRLWSGRHSTADRKHTESNTVDVNPDFRRNDKNIKGRNKKTSEEKVLRLKQRLNWAIFIVVILIIIVIFALLKL